MTLSQELQQEVTYEISCINCKAIFDSMEAVWCGCLSLEQTLICPSCLHCFCKAPKSYLDAFWDDAPQEIWDKKIEQEKSLLLPKNPDPDSVIRPVILIVDDEELILKLAIKAVESFGYTAISAKDGIEALALAKLYKPDLILSDILMPRLEGGQLCRFVKSDPQIQNIKVVLMTSLYTKSKYKVDVSKNSHPDDYVSKPLDFQKLQTVINRLLPALENRNENANCG